MPRRALPTSAALFLSLAGSLALSATAAADENRRGIQVEGMVGGSACMNGRADCHYDHVEFDGRTRPSFGTGLTIGARPLRWLMVGGMYRWGMFNSSYHTLSETDAYRWSGQHTAAVFIRPMIPVWRFDLGFNVAPGYSRQVFRRNEGRDADYSQGFAMLVGPTVDVYLTDRFFIGAEVDLVFNAHRESCRRRGGETSCTEQPQPSPAPTHQALFGLNFGWTFL